MNFKQAAGLVGLVVVGSALAALGVRWAVEKKTVIGPSGGGDEDQPIIMAGSSFLMFSPRGTRFERTEAFITLYDSKNNVPVTDWYIRRIFVDGTVESSPSLTFNPSDTVTINLEYCDKTSCSGDNREIITVKHDGANHQITILNDKPINNNPMSSPKTVIKFGYFLRRKPKGWKLKSIKINSGNALTCRDDDHEDCVVQINLRCVTVGDCQ